MFEVGIIQVKSYKFQ